MSHDPRCTWSKTPPSRCRCSCNGTQHGTAVARERLGFGEQPEENDQ
jgi:hypothetical protein